MINIELINDFSCSSFHLQQIRQLLIFKDGIGVIGSAELIDGPTLRVQRILTLNIGPLDDIEAFIRQLNRYIPTLKIVIKRSMSRKKLRDLKHKIALLLNPLSRGYYE